MPPPDTAPRSTFIPADPIPVPSVPGLVSVVVLCCGQLEFTRLCVPSVLRFSRPPFEVIAVDSGALDGTAEYWSGVQAAASVRVGIVRSPAETDLAAALRAGLDRATGEAVAPMTNYGPGHQVVWPVPYRLGAKASTTSGPEDVVAQIEAVDRFAQDWREQHRGQWSETDRLGGGCVVIRRSALRAVGTIPTGPLRFFDPEALSRRVVEAGFCLACCRDLFVHSFGSRSVAPLEPGTSDRRG
jgi:GT2 family glycosyltransferase